MASSLRVNAIVPASGTNVAIGTAGGTITYTASVSGVSTFSSGVVIGTGTSISSPSTNVLALGVNNTERVRINTTGVGIGTTNTTSFNGACDDIVVSGGSDVGMTFYSTSTTGTANIAFTDTVGSNTQGAINYVHNGDYMIFQTNLSERVRIDSSGRVTKPYQPAFSVYPASGTPIGSGTLTFTGVRFNIGNNYSTSTGRFTAPVAGIYLMILTAQHYGGTATNGWIDLRLNDAEINARYETFDGAQYTSGGISAVVQMAAGDYITIVPSANIFHDDNTNFSGYLLG
jgi:hypothetical protein